MRAIGDRSVIISLDTIQRGMPNEYIGNPGVVNAFNGTPLIFLIQRGTVEQVRYALEHGANPNIPCLWGGEVSSYPLQGAFSRRQAWELVQLLLQHGAEKRNLKLQRALQDAIWPAKCNRCVQFLLDEGAQPNSFDGIAFLPLTWVQHRWEPRGRGELSECNRSLLESARILLRHGATRELPDEYGNSFVMANYLLEQLKHGE
jgi:ankyrin repeat protein